MRMLLALVLFVLAGFLIWHGFKTADLAKAELDAQKGKIASPNFERLLHAYPYSSAAVEAREITVASQVKAAEHAPAGKIPGKDELKSLAVALPDRTKKGVATEEPFVHPDAAAVIGLAGLLLALVLPGTRFRGLAFLGILVGGAAVIAAMLPADNQVALINKVGPLQYVIASFPRVAQGCVALAAITLGARVGGARSKSSN
jgi:hypothetical protein